MKQDDGNKLQQPIWAARTPRWRFFAVLVVVPCVFALALLGCQEEKKQEAAPVVIRSPGSAPVAPIASTAKEPIARAPADTDWFEDVTLRSGVKSVYDNGMSGKQYTVLETIGGGVAMIDFDRDGDLDLFFTGGGTIVGSPPSVTGAPPKLYRNDGDWHFVDVTEQVGLSGKTDYSHGATVADFNRDGFPDLFVTCYGQSRLYKNEEGKRFVDVTESSGLVFQSWSTAAAWLDFDLDGWPDLYVGGYVDWTLTPGESCGDIAHHIPDICPPQKYPPSREKLFRNTGHGTFEDVSQKVGLEKLSITLGAVAADFNDDGITDLYVANDVMRNYLYWGTKDGRLREGGIVAGAALNEFGAPEGSMGVDAGDYDGDGQLDVFVTNYQMEDNSLYRNDGNGYFTHSTTRAGLAGPCRPLVGFGAAMADLDGDGWLDLLVVNGHVMYTTGVSSYRQPSFVFRNRGGTFEDVSREVAPYFTAYHVGRGAAVGDLDNDGGMDMVIVHQNEPAVLLRNRRAPEHWVRVELRGTNANSDAIGATVWTKLGDRKLVRPVSSGAGFLSQFDRRIVFPLTSEAPADVCVRWPGGKEEHFAGLAAHQSHVLVEGKGEPSGK